MTGCAGLDQRTLGLETRIDYTFSPGLSLQVFAQPLIASGAFGAVKELAAPRTFDFLVYGRDVGEIADGRIYPAGQGGDVSFPVPQPDFNLRSLRGNAVLRWEWRPGSTMYVAWQQRRQDVRPFGDFDPRRDIDAVFARSPDDVLLVKVSYWLNPQVLMRTAIALILITHRIIPIILPASWWPRPQSRAVGCTAIRARVAGHSLTILGQREGRSPNPRTRRALHRPPARRAGAIARRARDDGI